MVAENDFGIQPEDIFLSCSLTFHGNIAPELEWKASDESDIIDKINISNTSEKNGKKIVIQAVTQAFLKQDGSQYVCQTKRSQEKYPCYSAMVKTLCKSHFVVAFHTQHSYARCHFKTVGNYYYYYQKSFSKNVSKAASSSQDNVE